MIPRSQNDGIYYLSLLYFFSFSFFDFLIESILKIEMEKMPWPQQQKLAEVKHKADLLMMELRQTVEAVKQKVLGLFFEIA